MGGGAAIALAAAYLAIIPLYAFAGSTPTGGEELLVYLETRAGLWWAILALSVLTDLLFVLVAFALHSALPGRTERSRYSVPRSSACSRCWTSR